MFDVVQDAHLKNLAKVRSWQSNFEANFKICYKESAKVINGVAENLGIHGKLVGVLKSGVGSSFTIVVPLFALLRDW